MPAIRPPSGTDPVDGNTRLLRIGIGGTAIAALCCFTPILVVLLGVLGATAWVGHLDYVLFPTLAACIGLTVDAWRQRRRALACCTPGDIDLKEQEK